MFYPYLDLRQIIVHYFMDPPPIEAVNESLVPPRVLKINDTTEKVVAVRKGFRPPIPVPNISKPLAGTVEQGSKNKQLAENLISDMSQFLESNYIVLKKFPPLNRRPVTQKTCKMALELIKTFSTLFPVESVPSYHCEDRYMQFEAAANNKPLTNAKEFKISLASYDALVAYSNELGKPI